VKATRLASFSLAAPEENHKAGEPRCFAEIGRQTGSDQRSRGIDHHDIARRTGFAFQNPLDQRRIFGGRPSADRFERCARHAEIFRRHLEALDRAASHLRDRRLSRKRNLIQAARPMHHKGALDTQFRQRCGNEVKHIF